MIPNYEEIMLPFFKYLSDEKEHSLSETHDALAKEFKLTDYELKELLPSGQQPVFRNRLGWARTYLKKAGLLTSPKRAHFKISDAGLALLQEILELLMEKLNHDNDIPLALSLSLGGKVRHRIEHLKSGKAASELGTSIKLYKFSKTGEQTVIYGKP